MVREGRRGGRPHGRLVDHTAQLAEVVLEGVDLLPLVDVPCDIDRGRAGPR